MVRLSTRLHKSQKNSKGQSPVVLQITWDRKVRRKSTGVWVKQHQFYIDDDGNGRIQNVSGRKQKADTIKDYKKYGRRILEDHFEDVPFNYKKFSRLLERKLKSLNGEEMSVSDYAREVSNRFHKEKRVRSGNDYKHLASILDTIQEGLTFSEFTEDFLKEVEEYIIKQEIKGYDLLNRIKILYNKAVQDRYANPQLNPFKNEYTNPYGFDISKFRKRKVKRTSTNRVKDLTKSQLRQIKGYEPQTSKEEEYLDIWFFSFYCFGVNMTDVAKLRPEHIKDGRWYYKRSKTGVGLKGGKPLLPQALNLIEKYSDDSPYVFPILNDNMSEREKNDRARDYAGYIRKAMKRISKKLGWEVYFTYYSARHSAITLALNEGMDKNTISKLADHKNLSTLDHYAGSADDEKVLETMKTLGSL